LDRARSNFHLVFRELQERGVTITRGCYSWFLDSETRIVARHNKAVHLEPQQFTLVNALYVAEHRTLTGKEITKAVWPAGNNWASQYSIVIAATNKKLKHIKMEILNFRRAYPRIRRHHYMTELDYVLVLRQWKSP
jgi:DNA-binding response OmpR family regulator